jgi:hypothetical protein
MNATMTCCLRTNTGSWCQESYETASRQAGVRAKQLRALGYNVTVGSLGPQVTPVGTVKLTMVTIRPGANADTFGLPQVQEIGW